MFWAAAWATDIDLNWSLASEVLIVPCLVPMLKLVFLRLVWSSLLFAGSHFLPYSSIPEL